MKKLLLPLLILVALIIFSPENFGQEKVFYITYSPSAPTREGDNDFLQMIFFSVPQSQKDSIFLRIFDADCGDNLDITLDKFDSQTEFILYGGAGSFSGGAAQYPLISSDAVSSGTEIKKISTGIDPFLDNKWLNFAPLAPQMGELYNGRYYFRLVVKGLNGNDGNLFDVAVSTERKQNIEPEGLELFSYAPTLRIPRKGVFAEVRFQLPQGMDEVTVFNFDVAGAAVSVETPFRSNLNVPASGQDEWANGKVSFLPDEPGRVNAVLVEGGIEMPNDFTVYVVDKNGKNLPMQLPAYLWTRNNRPVANYTAKTLSDCYTVVFDGAPSTDRDGDAMLFAWEFGDGTKGEGTRIAHKFDKFGTYSARVIVSDLSGQVGNSTIKEFTFKINEPPVAKAGSDVVVSPGSDVNLSASASYDNDGKIIRYIWDMGDGTKLEGVNIRHKYVKAGNYTVQLRVEDDSDSPCNFAADELKVIINSQPVAEAGKNIISAVNEEITLNGALSYDSDGELTKFEWDFGDGSTGTGTVVNHAYKAPGKYTVTLKITDNTGASNNQAFDQLVVTVNDRPLPEAGANQIVAAGEAVQFDGGASVDRDGSITAFNWVFGDGASGSGQKVSHVYKAPGVYSVVLTVKDNSGSISETNSDSLTIIVNFPPVAEAGTDQLVSESVVKFNGSASRDQDGNITAYLWEFGDGSTSRDQNPVHVYGNPGTYKVKLTVTDNTVVSSNKHSDEMTVIVNAPPVADAGPDRMIAINEKTLFDASKSVDPDGSIVSYEWDFGDGNKASGTKNEHSYTSPGIYTVKLTVKDNTGHTDAYSTDFAIVRVNAAPVAKAGNDIIAAPGDKVTFNAAGSFDTDGKTEKYIWSFSDGTETYSTPQVTREFTKPGTYYGTVTVSDNSGAINNSASDKVEIRINSTPVANAGKNVFTCNTTIIFDATQSSDPDGDALVYKWDFGDQTVVTAGAVVTHTYDKEGTYPVVLTVDDGRKLKNSVSTASLTVKINQAPVADAGDDRTICAGDLVLFDGSGSKDPEGGLLKYYWDFGDGTTAEGMNPAKRFDKAGSYQVRLRVKDDSELECNSDLDQIVVLVAESPVAAAGDDQTVCANALVYFDGSKSEDFDGVVNNFHWDFGDGNTGAGEKPTHVYLKPGKYRVVLTITGDLVGECDNKDTDEMYVTVTEAPAAKMDYPKMAAQNEPVNFDASGSLSSNGTIISYNWDFGDGTTGTGEKVSKTYLNHGKYFVKLTVKTNTTTDCGTSMIRDYIIVNAKPVAEAGADMVVGAGEIFVLNGSESKDPDGSIVQYYWNLNEKDTARGIEVKHKFDKPGSYPIILNVKDNTDLSNNYDSDTLMLVVNDPLANSIDAENSACVNETVNFAVSSPGAPGNITYTWNFGDGNIADGATAQHKYIIAGNYTVTLTADDGKKVENSITTVTKPIKINTPPYANAGPDRVVCPGDAIMFDASLSSDIDNDSIYFDWQFGDGNSASVSKAEHKFSRPGIYYVVLSVNDRSGSKCQLTTDTAIVKVNSTPVPVPGRQIAAFTGGAYDAVLFDASASSDPDGDPLTFEWDFGDGTKETGSIVKHMFAKPGNFKVTLTVKDNSGLTCGSAVSVFEVIVQKR